MPTSNSKFNSRTTGHEIVAAYQEHVKDKIILITGANPGGIGLSTAVSLAKASPKLLIIAGRNSEKLQETAKAIKDVNGAVAVKPLHLDLSSQQSCRDAAKQVLEDPEIPHLDLLINNAGVMHIAERTLSPDGIEMQFATNHIGHFLFTNLILPKLIAAAAAAAAASSQKQSNLPLPLRPTRILNLSSRAVLYSPVRFSDWNFTKKEAELPESEHMTQAARQQWDKFEDVPYVPQAAYGQSKSANVLFSHELNERLLAKHGILSIAVHPGGIRTNLSRHLTAEELEAAWTKVQKVDPNIQLKDLDQGCSSTLTAALDPKIDATDLFFADCQPADWAPPYATDPAKAKQLWQLSEELVGEKF